MKLAKRVEVKYELEGVVWAGSVGIAFANAPSFLQKCESEGAEVIATDINFDKLKELQEEKPSIKIDCLDVTKSGDVESMLKEKYSHVNVLFNCAG